MSLDSDQRIANSKTASARTLHALKETILAKWLARVKSEIPSAKALANPIIVDTIPLFLANLADALCEETDKSNATESSNVAQEHGSERARVTRFGPEQILIELQLLRETVREVLSERITLTTRDENIIQKSFDKALQESMVTYFLVHGRIREQLLVTLTHDLREPLSAVKMSADLISQLSTDAESSIEARIELKKIVKKLRSNIGRMDRMVQELIDSSVVQVGEKIQLNITAGNIADVLSSVVTEYDHEKSRRFVVESISVPGYWDHRAFRRTIESLIRNMEHYSPPDTKIGIRARFTHGRLMVSVSNTAAFIPGENIESLFQAFLRSDTEEAGWGTGLGLARATVEQMGGSLGIDSSIEQGTTLTIDVPADTRPFQDAPLSVPVPQ